MLFWNNGIKAVVVDGTSIADIGLQPQYTMGIFPILRTPVHSTTTYTLVCGPFLLTTGPWFPTVQSHRAERARSVRQKVIYKKRLVEEQPSFLNVFIISNVPRCARVRCSPFVATSNVEKTNTKYLYEFTTSKLWLPNTHCSLTDGLPFKRSSL